MFKVQPTKQASSTSAGSNASRTPSAQGETFRCTIHYARGPADAFIIEQLRRAGEAFVVVASGTLVESEGWLEAGAEGCVSSSTPLSQLRSLLKESHQPYRPKALRLDQQSESVRIGDRDYVLTRTEFKLFEYLAGQMEHWVRSAVLAEEVLATELRYDSAAVRAHFFRMRRKLGSVASHVQSNPRKGYRLSGLGP